MAYVMVISGPPLRPREVEGRVSVVEVTVLWGESVLDVAHVRADRCAVALTRAALVRGGLDPKYAALADGLPIAHADPAGATSTVRAGLTFVARRTLAGRRVGVGASRLLALGDPTTTGYIGVAALIAAFFLALVWSLPPRDRGVASAARIVDDARIAEYVTAVAPPDHRLAQQTAMETRLGPDGKRADDDPGRMGDREAPHRAHRSALAGSVDPREAQMAYAISDREMARAMTTRAGVLGVLREASATWHQPSSPFGRDVAEGSETFSALGAIMGDHVGDSFGFGGLGMRGTGRGGGGAGEGTYGVRAFGRMGYGVTCDATCTAAMIGHGHGIGTGTGVWGRSDGPPRETVVPGALRREISVAGSLSAEVIRRVVGRHVSEVRHCYERALTTAPDLAGRVTVAFVIAASGAVQSSVVVDARTDLASTDASSCVAESVRRWSFPAPEGGGVVAVTYPFVLATP